MSNPRNDSDGIGAARRGSPSPSGMAAFNVPNRNARVVSEEQPMMRSVGMMSAGPAMSLGPSLGMSKPSLGIAPLPRMMPPPLKGMPRPGKLGGAGGSSDFGVKNEWEDVVTAPAVWDVKGENLEKVPVDYPLERTHREIYGAEATEVATRISDAVRVLSIHTKFDGENAKAKCKTSDLVSFRIRLYAGGEGGQPVVVELQRRSGPSSSFMKTCRAILNAAEGEMPKSPLKPQALPPFMKGPVRDMKCLESAPIEVNESEIISDLESALTLFRSKNLDSTLLGLENMCYLTDPLKTSPSTARLVSIRVILGDDKNDIRDDVGALLQRDVFPPELEQDEGFEDHMEKLRHHALTLFANSLDVCSKDGALASAIKSCKWFETFLVPSLTDEIKSVQVCSISACQAVRCLQSLASCSDVACRLIVSNSGVEVLEEARDYSLHRHELLANEARRCLATIEPFAS